MEALKTVCGIHNNNLITDANTIKKVDKIIYVQNIHDFLEL